MILIGFGASTIRNVYRGSVSTSFFDPVQGSEEKPTIGRQQWMGNPVIGGIFVSMSNPYWWVWWATIGFAFILQFDISFRQWPKLIAFSLGHEAGDLICYLIVSTLAFLGLRHLNKKVYYGILIVCGIFMMLFGIYMGVSPIFKGEEIILSNGLPA